MLIRDAFAKHHSLKGVQAAFREDYIQHNPNVPTGRKALESFLPALKKAGLKHTTYRLIQDGNFIVQHVLYENAELFGSPKVVAFDVWRMQDGKVAEHWDAIQPFLGKKNPAGRTIIDGATEITDFKKTEANKALVREFYHEVFVKGNAKAAGKYIEPDIRDYGH